MPQCGGTSRTVCAEISQPQRDKHCVSPCGEGPWRSQIHRDREEGGGDRAGRRGGEGTYCLLGTEFSSELRESSGDDGGDGGTIM